MDSGSLGNTAPDNRSVEARVRIVEREFLFLVLDCERPLVLGARFDVQDVVEIVIGRSAPGKGRHHERTQGPDGAATLRLSFPSGPPAYLAREHVRLRRVAGGWDIKAVSDNGVRIEGEKVDRDLVKPGQWWEAGRLVFTFQRMRDSFPRPGEYHDFDAEVERQRPEGLRTLIPELARQFEELRMMAEVGEVITLVGETGSGKGVTAKAVHAVSGRRGPFLAENCGAIPDTLLESQLFGHGKAAFTGATVRPGLIREAQGGTVFLDEIVDASPEVQVALLRAIEERRVKPIGSDREFPVDALFVVAAQIPLEEAVATRGFRRDLHSRLRRYRFFIPPLRERLVDLGILLASALGAALLPGETSPRIHPSAALALLRRRWELNVRELVQDVGLAWRRCRLDGTQEIAPHHLPPSESPGATEARVDWDNVPEASRRETLTKLLLESRVDVPAVAAKLEKHEQSVYRWIKTYGIDLADLRSRLLAR